MTRTIKVLIAYDGTESSQRAVGYASRVLAQGRTAEAVVITAWESTIHQTARLSALSGVSGPTESGIALDPNTADAAQVEAERANAEGVELAQRDGFTARGELVPVSTTVWTAIIDAANDGDYDVIVTGSRGMTGLRALWHSSVSEHVLRGCRHPVMIVPSGAPDL